MDVFLGRDSIVTEPDNDLRVAMRGLKMRKA